MHRYRPTSGPEILCIRANPAAWARPQAVYRLGRVERRDRVMLLRFERDGSTAGPIRVDQGRMICLLGHEPKVPIVEGLRETIRWQALTLGIELSNKER